MPEELHVAYDVNGLGQWVADSIPDSFTIMTDDEVDANPHFGIDSRIEIIRLNSIIRRLTNGYNNTLRNAVERTDEHDGCNEGKFDFINGINFSWRRNPINFKVEAVVSLDGVGNPFGADDIDSDDSERIIDGGLPTRDIDGGWIDWDISQV